jgi:hypothetical protein
VAVLLQQVLTGLLGLVAVAKPLLVACRRRPV